MSYQSRLHKESESEKLRLELAIAEAKGTARCTIGGIVAVQDRSERGPSAALLDLPALRRLRDQIDLAIACAEQDIAMQEESPPTLRGSVLLTDEAPTSPFNPKQLLEESKKS